MGWIDVAKKTAAKPGFVIAKQEVDHANFPKFEYPPFFVADTIAPALVQQELHAHVPVGLNAWQVQLLTAHIAWNLGMQGMLPHDSPYKTMQPPLPPPDTAYGVSTPWVYVQHVKVEP